MQTAATPVPINNLNYIRLLAALQVLFFHSAKHFGVTFDTPFLSFIEKILRAFPGVPVFFMISGFLITHSWLAKPDIKRYVRTRFLRIFPALWVCLFVNIICLWC